MLALREGLLKEAEALDDLIGGINVERRPVALDERFHGNFAAVQRAAGLRQMKGARG
jgi:hypothetical protein